MTAAREPLPWPGRRWVLFVLIILAGQLTIILWLSGMKIRTPDIARFAPPVFFLPANARAEWLDATDPTIFALANRRGFSGPAWMQVSSQPGDQPRWTEPTRPLDLPTQKLGGALAEFARTHPAGSFDLSPPDDLDSDLALPTPQNLGVPHSELAIQGDLAHRPLISEFNLQPQPATDILTNSVVLAAVDAQGNVFSTDLIKGSGSVAADKDAVLLARSAQFQPLPVLGPNPPAAQNRLTWGQFIFRWQTVPVATNIAVP